MILISDLSICLHLIYTGDEIELSGVPYAKIAAIFSAFILFETWPMPVAGYFVDKLGIRKLMSIGAVCIALGVGLGGTVAKSPLRVVHILRRDFRHGRGNHLHLLRRQRREVVSRSPRVSGWPYSRGLRWRCRASHHARLPATIRHIGWAHAMAVWGLGQGIIAIWSPLISQPPAGGLGSCGVGPKARRHVRRSCSRR